MIRFSLLAALAASAVAVPAVGQTNDGVSVVRHTDLKLSKLHDIARLDRRIDRAASTACGPVSSIDPAGVDAHTRCKRETIAATRAQRDAAIRRSEIQEASVR